VRDIALDPTTGDLAWTRGADGLRRLSLTSGAGAVRQKLSLRLGIAQGEHHLDASVGMPLFQQVFTKASGRRAAEGIFRRAIATCPGVASLDAFRLAVDSQRRATVTFAVTAVPDGTLLTVTDFVPAGA